MPYTQPDEAVAARLAAAGLGLTSGINLFMGVVRPPSLKSDGSALIPHRAVFCLASGGSRNLPYMGRAANLRDFSVQVRIRSAAEDFAGGQSLARQVLETLHRAELAGYVQCLVREPHPNYLEQDPDGTHHWSLNARLTLKT